MRKASGGRHIEEDEKTRSVRVVGAIKPREMGNKTFKDRRKAGAEWGGIGRRVKAGDPSQKSIGLWPVEKGGHAAAR